MVENKKKIPMFILKKKKYINGLKNWSLKSILNEDFKYWGQN